jgi:hypothetical protein
MEGGLLRFHPKRGGGGECLYSVHGGRGSCKKKAVRGEMTALSGSGLPNVG